MVADEESVADPDEDASEGSADVESHDSEEALQSSESGEGEGEGDAEDKSLELDSVAVADSDDQSDVADAEMSVD